MAGLKGQIVGGRRFEWLDGWLDGWMVGLDD
jgi:hypothetical protein